MGVAVRVCSLEPEFDQKLLYLLLIRKLFEEQPQSWASDQCLWTQEKENYLQTRIFQKFSRQPTIDFDHQCVDIGSFYSDYTCTCEQLIFSLLTTSSWPSVYLWAQKYSLFYLKVLPTLFKMFKEMFFLLSYNNPISIVQSKEKQRVLF